MKRSILFLVGVQLASLINVTTFAACPSMDFTGDCRVNFDDFAIMASGWLTTYDANDLADMASEWLDEGEPLPDPNGMVFMPIPAGTFQMGDSFSEGPVCERPVHTVTLSFFKMSKYEITNGQYCDFLNSAYPTQIKEVDGVIYAVSDTGNSYLYCDTSASSSYSQIDFSVNVFSVMTKPAIDGRDMVNDPVVQVSWYGAVAYCNWLSSEEGKESCYNLSDTNWLCDFTKTGYRLPTEAEWEYAARGGLSGNRFPWGDTITHSQANYYSSIDHIYDISPTSDYHPTWNDGIEPYTSPVGSFSANGYGLHDMAGNVLEWCNDWYGSTYYSISPGTNPTGPTTGYYRVNRGGGWHYEADFCRVSFRNYHYPPSYHHSSSGFRVCLD